MRDPKMTDKAELAILLLVVVTIVAMAFRELLRWGL